jgi:uncharacterized protein (DUF2062 family)
MSGRVLRRLAQRGASPHSVALGTSIGVFVAMTPTVGLQMLIGICIATLLRANRVAAALPAWITNPATIVPIYSFNYWLGRVLTREGPGVDEFVSTFTGILELVKTEGAWAAMRALLALGVEIQLPLWTGCILVGIVLALPTYPAMRRVVTLFHRRRAMKKRYRHQRFMELLQKREEERLAAEHERGQEPS